MGQIVINDLDDTVLDALRRLAAEAGISTEEQARRALGQAVRVEREAAVQRFAEFRRQIGPLPGPSTLEDLRRDRDRDDA